MLFIDFIARSPFLISCRDVFSARLRHVCAFVCSRNLIQRSFFSVWKLQKVKPRWARASRPTSPDTLLTSWDSPGIPWKVNALRPPLNVPRLLKGTLDAESDRCCVLFQTWSSWSRPAHATEHPAETPMTWERSRPHRSQLK